MELATQPATVVIWGGFTLAFIFGAVANRANFCTMGAVADIVNIGDWTRMRMWLLAIGVAMLGFISAVGGGMIRDMLVNDIPFILHQDFYGTVSILVALGWYGLQQLGWYSMQTEYALFALGLALRLWAHRQALALPAVSKRSRMFSSRVRDRAR